MSLIQMDFSSTALQRFTTMEVFLPDINARKQLRKPLSDDNSYVIFH